MYRYSRSKPKRAAGQTPTRTVLLLSGLLLASALAACGCGESTSGQSAAASNPAATPPTTSPTTDGSPSTSGTAASSIPTSTPKPDGSPGRQAKAGPVKRSRAHLVLPPPGSHPEPKLTASEKASLPVTDILLSSTAIASRRGSSTYTIARQYTCGGSNTSLPLHWSGVPKNTSELVLFAISSTPVQGKLYFDWALAGLNPSLKGLQAGQLPPGAVVGRNSERHDSYSICPHTGKPENYIFILYALPKSLTPKPGFDPTTLRLQAKQVARHTGLLVGDYG